MLGRLWAGETPLKLPEAAHGRWGCYRTWDTHVNKDLL